MRHTPRAGTSQSIRFDCVMSKMEHRSCCSVLRNYTADEGRPLEPACRSRTQTTFRCCSLRGVVVSGEGKGPGERPGQVTSRERNESEPLPCRKVPRRCRNHGSQKIVGSAPAVPAYGRSGIRHTGG